LIAHLDADDSRRHAVDAALAEHADQELLTHGYVIAETLPIDTVVALDPDLAVAGVTVVPG